METSLTLFKSTFDNKTHRKMSFHSWDDFKRLLFDLSKQERKGKKDAELISPATYVDGTTRANRNVLASIEHAVAMYVCLFLLCCVYS